MRFLGSFLAPKCVPLGYCDEDRNRDEHCPIRPHKDNVLAAWAEKKAAAKKSQSPLDAPRPKYPVKDKYREPQVVSVPKKPDGDVRLFQSKPGRKEWLTKAEAEERGHVWVDNPGKAGIDRDDSCMACNRHDQNDGLGAVWKRNADARIAA